MFFICIFRGIKLPAVQSQLAKRGGAAKRGGRGRGGRGSKASFTNVKQEQESENEDPLGSEPGSEETEDKKVKESEKRKPTARKPTARRGKRFTAGQAPERSSKDLEVIDCSVELSEIEGDAKKRKIKKRTGSKKLESDIEIIEEEKKEEKLQPKKKANGSRKIEVKKTAENRTEEIKKSDAVEVPPSNIETEVVSDGMHLDTVAAYVNDVNDAELPIPQPQMTEQEKEIERLEKEIGSMLETRTKIKDSEKRISVLKNILKALAGEAAKDEAKEKEERELNEANQQKEEKKKKEGERDSVTEEEKKRKEGERDSVTEENGKKTDNRYVNSNAASNVEKSAEPEVDNSNKEDSVSDVNKEKNEVGETRTKEEEKLTQEDKSKEEGKTEQETENIRNKEVTEVTSKKSVTFEADFEISEEDIERKDVQVMVDNVVHSLVVGQSPEKETSPEKGRIDEIYVKFPSSQAKEEAFLKKYSVATEDITDAEEESEAANVETRDKVDETGGENVIIGGEIRKKDCEAEKG